MEKFRETLIGCDLGDLGYRGSKFTWSNKQESRAFLKEQLDRAVASPSWGTHFPNSVVEVLPTTNSDHNPIWLQCDFSFRVVPKLFRFEAKWNLDDECSEVVREAWTRGAEDSNRLGCAAGDLDRCRASLTSWSKAKYGDANRRLALLSKKLAFLQGSESLSNQPTIKEMQEEINKLLEMEELKWRQRAKRNWFAGGERNT